MTSTKTQTCNQCKKQIKSGTTYYTTHFGHNLCSDCYSRDNSYLVSSIPMNYEPSIFSTTDSFSSDSSFNDSSSSFDFGGGDSGGGGASSDW